MPDCAVLACWAATGSTNRAPSRSHFRAAAGFTNKPRQRAPYHRSAPREPCIPWRHAATRLTSLLSIDRGRDPSVIPARQQVYVPCLRARLSRASCFVAHDDMRRDERGHPHRLLPEPACELHPAPFGHLTGLEYVWYLAPVRLEAPRLTLDCKLGCQAAAPVRIEQAPARCDAAMEAAPTTSSSPRPWVYKPGPQANSGRARAERYDAEGRAARHSIRSHVATARPRAPPFSPDLRNSSLCALPARRTT